MPDATEPAKTRATHTSDASLAHRTRQMSGRDPHEPHRASTPLELLFDLSFVVGFSVASTGLADGIAEGHPGAAIVGFGFAMYAVCWAWINFSWFASAFDTDDWMFRVTTMVQMIGVLILALGLKPMFASLQHGGTIDNRVMVLGYVVMRVALVFQWLRVARQSAAHRRAGLLYAGGICLAQLGWVVLAVVHQGVLAFFLSALLLGAVEMAAPIVAERRSPTPWHAHHIAERYSLMTIIALGEGIVGTVAALGAVVDTGGWTWQVAVVGLAAVGTIFGIWWMYFTLPSGELLAAYRDRRGFVWGFGHIVVFGAIAAVGAGLHVVALYLEAHAPGTGQEQAAGHAVAVGASGALLAVAVPVAVYLTAVFGLYGYLVRQLDRLHLAELAGSAGLLIAAVVLAGAHVPLPVCLLLVMCAPLVVVVGYEVSGHVTLRATVARVTAAASTQRFGAR